jgi:hypothetical protein
MRLLKDSGQIEANILDATDGSGEIANAIASVVLHSV